MATSSEAEESKIIHSRRRCKVLLCGHQSSGKSTAKRKIIELSTSMSRSAGVQSSGDLESTVDKVVNRQLSPILGRRVVEFQGIKYNTKTSTYEFVMAPSHHLYVPNMMSRALQADIAVLFVSGVGDDDIPRTLKDLQSEECANMVMGLGITKFLLVITKMDGFKSRRYDRIKERMVTDLKRLGFGNDFQCIPVSFEDMENIDSQRGKDPCFFDALDAIELTAYDKRTRSIEDESNFIKSLVIVDLLLDKNSSDATSWYERAILLEKISNKSKYQASVELEKANRQTLIAWGQVQAAKISNYMASLEAAENAAKFGLSLSKKEEDIAVPYLVQGYQCRAENKLEAACAHFESAVELFRKKTQPKNKNAVVTKLEEILRDISKQLEESKETSSAPSHKKDADVVKPRDKQKDKVSSKSHKKNEDEVKPHDEGNDEVSTTSREKWSLVVDKKKDKRRDRAEAEDFARAPSHKKDADVVKSRDKQKDKVSSTSHKKNEDEVKPHDEGKDEVSAPSHKKDADEVEPRDKEKDNVSSTSHKKNVNEVKPRDEGKYEGSGSVTITIITEYQVEKIKDTRLIYDGSKIVNDIKLRCSFVECSEAQLKNYESLSSLGLSDSRVLSVMNIMSYDNKKFFVVQPVKGVDTFFFELKSQRLGDDEDVCKWWLFIEDKFRKIFRGVVDALLHLYSKIYSGCGNLFGVRHHSVYITNDNDEKVQILPSMDSTSTISNDISDLVKYMRGIINLPRGGEDSLKLSVLPGDVSHLLSFLNPAMLNHVPPSWLLDHYFFWTPEECFEFIFTLRDLMKSHRLLNFDVALNKEMNLDKFWPYNIPSGTLYHEIYKKGSSERPKLSSDVEISTKELRKSGYFLVGEYETYYHIVSYMCAVYTHCNDEEYKNYRNGKDLDKVEVECELRKMFPKIYEQIRNALYACAAESSKYATIHANFCKELMKLSRRHDSR